MKSSSVKLGVVVLVIAFPILCYGANMIERIGEYHLGQDIKTVRSLVEFTPEEYAVFHSFPGWFDLPGERIFKAPEVTFNQHLWYLTIGALNGRIYTLGFQYINNDRTVARSVFEETLNFIKSQMGTPTEQTKTPKRYIWDSTDGNVLLAEREAMGFWCINLLLTSRAVEGYELDHDFIEAQKRLSNDIVKFQKQQKYMQVMLYKEISEKLLKEPTFEPNVTESLAGQIVNYYSGFDIDEQFKNMEEPNKSRVAKIRQWIIPKAEEILKKNYKLRRLIVYTLRIDMVYKFAMQGEKYLESDEKKRKYSILLKFGPEFPEEANPQLFDEIFSDYFRVSSPSFRESFPSS